MSRRVGRLRLAALLPAIAPIAAIGVAITFLMTPGAGAAEETSPTASTTVQAQAANAPFEHELPNRPRNVPSSIPMATTIGASSSASPTAGSRSPAVPTSTASPGQAATPCRVTYRMVNFWAQGFQANVTLQNSGTAALRDWTLTWRNPDGVRITNAWNGVVRVSGADVTVTSASWNAVIEPGAAVTIGYTATTETMPAKLGDPTDFRVGGTTCTLA